MWQTDRMAAGPAETGFRRLNVNNRGSAQTPSPTPVGRAGRGRQPQGVIYLSINKALDCWKSVGSCFPFACQARRLYNHPSLRFKECETPNGGEDDNPISPLPTPRARPGGDTWPGYEKKHVPRPPPGAG